MICVRERSSRRRSRMIAALAVVCLFGLAADDPPKKKTDPKPSGTSPPSADKSKAKTASGSSKTAKKPIDATVTIKADDSTKARGAADLLRESGADRYGETDWSRIPRWRQTAFFGIRRKGKFLFM